MTNHDRVRKILILTANPIDADRKRLAEEVREIQDGLKRSKSREQFQIESRWAARPRDVQQALLEYEPQIVHFSGHGMGADGLAFESATGQAILVSGKALATLFELFKDKVECVLLNACYSVVQAEAIHQHIDHVIGLSQALDERAAIEFAVGFYDALGAGQSYKRAYQLGCSSISLSGFQGSLTPVLLGRETGSVGGVPAPSKPATLPAPPPQTGSQRTSASPDLPIPDPAPPKENQQAKQWKQWPVVAILAVFVAGAAGIGWWSGLSGSSDCAAEQVRVNGQCVAIPADLSERFSSGEQVLFSNSNLDLEDGVRAFAQGNYLGAVDSFNNAIAADRNAPEPRIYLNNSRAREQGNPYVIAAVVPVDGVRPVAEAMLRGIADAQEQFNQKGGKDGRLLEVLIINDSQAPEIATAIAYTLGGDAYSSVLGVVGHSASETTAAALSEYERADLALVAPRAAQTELTGKNFFRTIPPAQRTSATLAEYAVSTLGVKKIAIFFDDEGNFSPSFKKSFVESFVQAGGDRAVAEFKLNQIFQNEAEANIQQAIDNGAQALVLIPSADNPSISAAITVARANAIAAQGQPLQLLGASSLYGPQLLRNGGKAVENMILAVPWFPDADNSYATEAEDRWGGQIDWTTASSFDATQAIIATLSRTVRRKDILERLENVNLSADFTSGPRLGFSSSHERAIDPVLVKVTEGGNRPPGAFAGFSKIN